MLATLLASLPMRSMQVKYDRSSSKKAGEKIFSATGKVKPSAPRRRSNRQHLVRRNQECDQNTNVLSTTSFGHLPNRGNDSVDTVGIAVADYLRR